MSLPGRTTASLVRGVNVEVGTDADLDPFIDAANELVTELCTASGYSDERLVKIETWLAAHFFSMDEPRNSRERVGGIAVSTEGKLDLMFDNSRFGQHAKLLDTAGNLAALEVRIKKGLRRIVPGIRWMGTVPEGTE